MNRVKGYHTASGYVGFLLNGEKMFFAPEQEYLDYIKEQDDNAA